MITSSHLSIHWTNSICRNVWINHYKTIRLMYDQYGPRQCRFCNWEFECKVNYVCVPATLVSSASSFPVQMKIISLNICRSKHLWRISNIAENIRRISRNICVGCRYPLGCHSELCLLFVVACWAMIAYAERRMNMLVMWTCFVLIVAKRNKKYRIIVCSW